VGRSPFLAENVRRYLVDSVVDEPEVLKQLRAETRNLEFFGMQIAADQGRFMALIVELLGVKKALEVGVYTGYSSISVALAMPDDGRLIACDISEEWTNVAKRFWKKAGVDRKIELRLGPAIDTLDGLLEDGQAASFDLAFIDADKANYDGYYERSLQLVRKGGLIAVDNALWGGSVADPTDTREDTVAIRTLNEKAHRDSRVTASLVAVGDGVLLARKH
jgi:caffeoyl-CoA O-methyltransferase